MEKILTIVIPTYNMQDYLRRCLDSLIVPKEQMKQLEVLVINDGSKDNSSAIAHEYQDKYPDTFRVIDKENGNYGSCVNRGLKEATGKYIKILDADDWFDTEALIKIVNIMKSIDVDLFLTDFNEVSIQGVITKRRKDETKPQNFIFDFEQHCINPYVPIVMHSVAYRRTLFAEFQYKQTEGISYTDMQWVFSPLAFVKTAFYCALPLYQYLLGREGQTMDENVLRRNAIQLQKMVEGLVIVYDRYKEQIRDNIKEYLFRVLKSQLYRIFILGLVDDAIPNDVLIAFDRNVINKNPELEEITNEIVISNSIRDAFIKKWRDSGYKPITKAKKLLYHAIKFVQIYKVKIRK